MFQQKARLALFIGTDILILGKDRLSKVRPHGAVLDAAWDSVITWPTISSRVANSPCKSIKIINCFRLLLFLPFELTKRASVMRRPMVCFVNGKCAAK